MLIGSKFYFTGNPCSRGHIAQRYTSGFACTECILILQFINKKKKQEYDKARNFINREDNIKRVNEWTKENPEKVRKNKKAWEQRNPEALVASAARRRAKQKSSQGSHNHHDIADIFKMQRGKCANCAADFPKTGKHRYHVDHIVAIANGGTNWPSNLQLLCPPCNRHKSAKDPIVWAQENGRLL